MSFKTYHKSQVINVVAAIFLDEKSWLNDARCSKIAGRLRSSLGNAFLFILAIFNSCVLASSSLLFSINQRGDSGDSLHNIKYYSVRLCTSIRTKREFCNLRP